MKNRIKAIVTELSKRNIVIRKVSRWLLYHYRYLVYAFIKAANKTDAKTICFKAFNGKSYSCSPKAIYEYMLTQEQFKDFNPQVVLFLIQRFFMFRLDMKLEDDDMLDIIQKIFNNNVRDFNTEAEFLNLEEFLVKVNECFNGKLEDDELYTYFLQIVNGIETLDRRDDGKNHGSI